MAYVMQEWSGYDEGKTLQENIDNGAVATAERMQHIEEGIAEADTLYTVGTVESVEHDAQPVMEITEEKVINMKVPSGAPGKSAYETAVEYGFEGTEEEWIASLKGEKGDQGLPGTGEGGAGTPGADGKSAYDIAVDNGFTGTEEEWVASLKGEQGETGPAGEDGVDGLDGKDGKNANVTAVEGTHTIAAADWQAIAEGDGAVSVEIAVDGITATSHVVVNITSGRMASVSVLPFARVKDGAFVIAAATAPTEELTISYLVLNVTADVVEA